MKFIVTICLSIVCLMGQPNKDKQKEELLKQMKGLQQSYQPVNYNSLNQEEITSSLSQRNKGQAKFRECVEKDSSQEGMKKCADAYMKQTKQNRYR